MLDTPVPKGARLGTFTVQDCLTSNTYDQW